MVNIYNLSFFSFFRNGHESVTHYLLENGANVNLINEEGYSAIIYATEEGHKTIAQQLKAKGAYMIDSYMFSFADLFPSFISDRFQKLRSVQRNNHGKHYFANITFAHTIFLGAQATLGASNSLILQD